MDMGLKRRRLDRIDVGVEGGCIPNLDVTNSGGSLHDRILPEVLEHINDVSVSRTRYGHELQSK